MVAEFFFTLRGKKWICSILKCKGLYIYIYLHNHIYHVSHFHSYSNSSFPPPFRLSCTAAGPGKPKGPLKVSDVTKKGCKLKWEKPEDDGGLPIQEYLVEKQDPTTGRWIPIGRTKVRLLINPSTWILDT